jgi:hypothetical protein
MGWGALMGLGQGLQQVGGMLAENNKQKLAAKLESERDAAKAARDEKTRQQQLLEPDPSRKELKMRDGALYEIIPNKSGGEFEARLASQDQIDDYNYNKKKEQISLEAATLGLDKGKREMADYDIDKALDRRYKESQINENNNQGLSAIMRATKSSEPEPAPTLEDAAAALVEDTADIKKEYTTAEGDATPPMTASEYRMVARDAVKEAAKRGVDARSFLTEALRRYVADKRSPAGKRAISE